jgi:hypothetical protein
MKAVLEFSYPEDEDKLRCALHGGTAISALDDVRRSIELWKHVRAEPEKAIDRVYNIVCDALRQCGEE